MRRFKQLTEITTGHEHKKHWLSISQQWNAVVGQSTRADNKHWARYLTDHYRQQIILEEDAE